MRDFSGLATQRLLARLCFPVFGALVVLVMRLRGYRIERLSEIRRAFAELVGQKRGPLLICSNHLTMIDSALITWAMASNWTYLNRFHLFPWNLPERTHYAHNLGLRLICYLAQCVPIVREGTAEQKRASLKKLEHLMAKDATVALFPEGKRSRDGCLDMESFGYGAGQLWSKRPDTTIVCLYLRGVSKGGFGVMPARGERFFVDIASVSPSTSSRGLRAARDVSRQIMNTLFEMEERYNSAVGIDSTGMAASTEPKTEEMAA